MAWMPGQYVKGALYLMRTPPVQGKVPYVREYCTPDDVSALTDLLEMNGREPLDVHTVRMILGKKALIGEVE